MEWYYSVNGEQLGPVDEAGLFQLAQQGSITANDLVWNHTMGDKWQPASTIPNLIPSSPADAPASHDSPPSMPPAVIAPTAVPPPGPNAPVYSGITENRELMRMARESLDGKWGIGVVFMLLYSIVVSGTSNLIPVVGGLISIFLAGPYMYTSMAHFYEDIRGNS